MPDPPCPPPASAKAPLTSTFSCETATVPQIIPTSTDCFNLAELVDMALQNSPQTRGAWYQAKQAAANVGIARGAYLPPVTFNTNFTRQRYVTTVIPGFEAAFAQTTYGPTVSTTYLLWDFGGRNAALQQALYALTSLNWTYNWQVQSVMIDVINNYYNYLNAIGILKASEATVKDNEITLEAAVALRQAGVKGLADELQARTNLLQSQLTLEQNRGTLNIARANLAQSLGLSPDTNLYIYDLPEKLEVEGVCQDMTQVLVTAKDNRADLMAMRANVLESRAKIKAARSNFFPTINTDMSYGYQWIDHQGPDQVYSIAVNVNYPFFNSFNDINTLRAAQAAWLAAQSDLDAAELQAFLDVLTDYYAFMANTEILKYSYEYIDVAQKNQEVAFANYTVGINTIIDVMTANNALNVARQQLVNAKTSWLTSLANLAYDTGSLSNEVVFSEEGVYPVIVD